MLLPTSCDSQNRFFSFLKVIFLEHGWFKEYETMRGIYNRLLDPEKGGQHFAVWGRGHFQVRLPEAFFHSRAI